MWKPLRCEKHAHIHYKQTCGNCKLIAKYAIVRTRLGSPIRVWNDGAYPMRSKRVREKRDIASSDACH